MAVRDVLEAQTPLTVELSGRSEAVLAQEVAPTVEMPYPVYVDAATGSRIRDIDGNEYIDLTMGYGPHVLGHAPRPVVDAVVEQAPKGVQMGLHNPHQTRLAELIIEAVPWHDEVVFCNSGTEATMYAIRAARAYTGKSKVALFDGNYHGAHDVALHMAEKSSEREAPQSTPQSYGIPAGTSEDVVMLPYRSEAAFDQIRAQKDELACVVLEPVQSSNPRLDQIEWMRELIDVCRESGVLFVMDEVITGFRLAYAGMQGRYDLRPDLVCYGKAVGGGMPIGAVVGPSRIMSIFGAGAVPAYADESEGGERAKKVRVFAGNTHAGNPMSMVAGIAALEELRDRADEIYPHLEEQGDRLAREINAFLLEREMPAQMLHAASMFHLIFQEGEIESSRDITGEAAALENEFYMHLMARGVIVPGIHIGFLSAAHTSEDVDVVIEAFKGAFLDLREAGKI